MMQAVEVVEAARRSAMDALERADDPEWDQFNWVLVSWMDN
jgi:hypothetical protein